MSRIYPLFIRNLTLPIYDIVRGTSILKSGRVLQKTQYFPRQEIERLQARNLRALLRHAYETVPYYRRVFRRRSLSPSDIRSVDDLVKLPILTKADIRANFGDLISRGFPRDSLILARSGGTGDQIKFYITKEAKSWALAAGYRAYSWYGYKLGDRCLTLWGSPIDLAKWSSMLGRLYNALNRNSVLNTYVVSDEVLGKLAYALKNFRPEIIKGYASSVYMMAKYLLERGVDCGRPRAVITSAETLLDYMRKTIEEAFGCPVFDFYGSREIGSMAAECEEHSGYHISAENVVLEFAREGEHVATGEEGVVLVTSLRNFGMPFIRYDIGDVGRPSDEACNCGRGLPLVSRIKGRVSQFMAVYDKRLGRVIPVSTAGPGVFGMPLMHMPLERYRIIQESLDRVIVKAVKGEGYSQKHTDFLVEHVRKYLGDNITIDVEFVDFLPPLPSGKRSVFISKINPFEQ
jgi:phenylacetate-CoA ligase